MTGRSMPIEEILPRLAETPSRLAALSAGLTPAQLRAVPAPGEWSANEVLAHLRACSDMWGRGIADILAGEQPTMRAINPRTWIRQTDYPDLEWAPSLQAFTAQRAELLIRLEQLQPEAWSRSAIFTGAGAPLVRTVHSFAERLARHERPHLKQIERIVNAVRG